MSRAGAPDLAGRVAVVTGANSGLGFETAKALAQRGVNVVLACRDQRRCSAAAEKIAQTGARGRTQPMLLDLADLDSVRAFSAEFARRYQRLDILVNNGGVMAPPKRHTTKQGFELQLGTNHLGHFALTGLLLPQLMRTPGSRVVTVSSFAHETGTIDFGDLQRERGYTPYGAYSQSKLANLLFMLELDRRLRSAGAATLSVGAHPGLVSTNLQATGPFLGRPTFTSWLVLAGVRLVGRSTAHGARPQLYAATEPTVTGGDYYGPSHSMGRNVAPSHISSRARNHETAARLWNVSREMTGVDIDAALGAQVEVSAR